MEQVLVKIISGVYGYDTGIAVIGKSVDDAPFLLEKEKAQRIIDLGVAEKVDTSNLEERDAETEPEQPNEEDTQTNEEDEQTELVEPLMEEDVDLESMTVQELKEFAEPFGVKYKVGTKKEDFITEIVAAMEAVQLDDDTLPSFDAETGVQQA